MTRLVRARGDQPPEPDAFGDSEFVLDPQQTLPDPRCTVGHRALSPDGRRLAWSYDPDGAERYVHLVRVLETGEDRVVTRDAVRDAAWSPGSDALVVADVDDVRRPHQIRRHGVLEESCTTVWVEPDPQFALRPRLSRSGTLVWLMANGPGASEIRFLDGEQVRPLIPRSAGVVMDVEHVLRADGTAHLLVTRGPAGDRRLEDIGLGSGGVPQPSELSGAARKQVPLPDGLRAAHFQFFAGGDLAVAADHDGAAVVLVRPSGAESFRVATAVGERSVLPDSIDDPRQPKARICVTGVDLPPVMLDVDVRDGAVQGAGATATLNPVLRRHRREVRSADGTPVPVTVLAHPDDPLTEPAPVLLEVYGAYGVRAPAIFDPARMPILNRGGRVAIAHVRGGGDHGPEWHRQAIGAGKPRTVADLLACAEQLRTQGVAERVVATGASAGGTMIAAALNVRPELFDGALLAMPFLDPLGAMRDPAAPFTVRDRLEWGDPLTDPRVDAVLSGLSPLQNVTDLPYPPVRVLAAEGDVRAPVDAVRAWVAAVRERSTSGAEVELVVHPSAGHEAAMGDDSARVAELAWSIPLLFPHTATQRVAAS